MNKKYARPDVLKADIQRYFLNCTECDTVPSEPGLLLYLNIPRKEMVYYLSLPEYEWVVEWAALYIEDYWIQLGSKMKAPRFPIFMLKAKHGYVEVTKKEIEDKRPHKMSDFDQEEIKALKQAAVYIARSKMNKTDAPVTLEHSDTIEVRVTAPSKRTVNRAAKAIETTKPVKKKDRVKPPKMDIGDSALAAMGL